MTCELCAPIAVGKQGSCLLVDVLFQSVERNGRRVELTSQEFRLLAYMIRHRGIDLTRDKLLADVWGVSQGIRTNVVDVYISYVRMKIGDGFIETVRGVGYRFA